jgi:hypothetical protein
MPLSETTFGCSERYAAKVACGGHSFLFSRRDVRGEVFETVVRWRRGRDDAWSAPRPTLLHANGSSLLMSHNAAFACLDNRTLAAYGGMDWQDSDECAADAPPPAWAPTCRGERGIRYAEAAATAPPLAWSGGRVIISGDPARSGCVEARRGWPRCAFDGKLSAARLGGRVLLYARANAADDGGGRHVQVAAAERGAAAFGRFHMVHFGGYELAAANNIYFLAARPLRVGGRELILAQARPSSRALAAHTRPRHTPTRHIIACALMS